MYYRLTYRNTTLRHHSGDSILCGRQPLHIGQTQECKAELPQSDSVVPSIYATILPDKENDGWYIVRRTDSSPVAVNGRPLQAAAPLHNGDKLSFTVDNHDIQMVFNICSNGDYSDSLGIVVRKHSRLPLLLACAVVLIIAAVAVIMMTTTRRAEPLSHEDFDRYSSSLYRITVDKVYLTFDTTINGEPDFRTICDDVLTTPVAGSCFLTDDGRFVTARHCIEPWLADESWDGLSFETIKQPDVMLAAKAETYNRTQSDRHYTVRSHCIISNATERYEFFSTDFIIDRSRDQVVCLGTAEHPVYWRTIIPLANRHDMELGDYAYVDADGISGEIHLADKEDIMRFDSQKDREVAILGFPASDAGDINTMTSLFGNSQHLILRADSTFAGCIPMSAPINKGNSGGPVMARVDGHIIAIGIVSKGDGRATQGTFWVVPTSELSKEIEEDTLIFRR